LTYRSEQSSRQTARCSAEKTHSGDEEVWRVLVLFSIGIIWLVYVWVGYPLMLGLLALVRRVHPKTADDYEPTVSVLFSARNEAKDIGWKLKQTLSWNYPHDKLQVLVASDASDDGTDDVIRAVEDPRLAFVRMEPRSGKNSALNRLAQEATGEIMFFTDANSEIDPDCVRRMVRHFADERVGCVTGEMHYVKEGHKATVATGARTYWGYESLIKRLESAIGSVLVCVGSIFCIRGSLFSRLQPDIANDLETPMLIGHSGYWLRYEPTAHSVERATHSLRQEAQRRLRICAQGFLGMWRLRHTMRGLRGVQFISRKALRWLTLVPLTMVFISTVVLSSHPVFDVLLKVELVLIGLAVIGALMTLTGIRIRGAKLFLLPFYIVLVSVSGFLGVFSVIFGRRFKTWETASRSGKPV
jgi:biofilm PGA synthesis N-glycosyltransferase PgaC